MPEGTALEAIVRRDRWIVGGALAIVTILCWLYLIDMATGMGEMDMRGMSEGMSMIRPWTAADFLLMFVMWAVMMVGMMLPSAAPMILLYARVERTNRAKGHVIAPTGLFVLGYVIVWSAFSLVATAAQWGLDQTALLSPMMVATSATLGGGLLIVAGAYQLTPLKYACLAHCRSPIQFITHHWRKGRLGALRMGIDHGVFCVGCCWALMILLFVGGVMNLLWIAALAIVVLLEKVVPRGDIAGKLGGVMLIGLGLWTLATA